MTLTEEQLQSLIATYAERVVDGMDVRDLCAFAIDMICDNMEGMSEEDVLKEIEFYYDDEEMKDLIESIKE
jgi:hypothetical protein